MTETLSFANRYGYSDVEPYEIVRRVSDKTVEVRAMNAVRSNPGIDMGFAPGGFLGHFADQDRQEWTITSNPNARIIRIRLRKDGRWYDSYDNRYGLSAKPDKFYDYNF